VEAGGGQKTIKIKVVQKTTREQRTDKKERSKIKSVGGRNNKENHPYLFIKEGGRTRRRGKKKNQEGGGEASPKKKQHKKKKSQTSGCGGSGVDSRSK